MDTHHPMYLGRVPLWGVSSIDGHLLHPPPEDERSLLASIMCRSPSGSLTPFSRKVSPLLMSRQRHISRWLFCHSPLSNHQSGHRHPCEATQKTVITIDCLWPIIPSTRFARQRGCQKTPPNIRPIVSSMGWC